MMMSQQVCLGHSRAKSDTDGNDDEEAAFNDDDFNNVNGATTTGPTKAAA